ncbi:TPA: replication protein P [Serratia marcescens]
MTNVMKFAQAPVRTAPQLFNDVFKVLRQICPAATATIKTDDELNILREQWVRAFAENGIRSMDQINAGLAEARRLASPFLPSPGQFIEWCQAAQRAGLPTAEELYGEFLTYCKRRGLYDSAEAYPWKSDAFYWLVTDLHRTMIDQRLTDGEVRKKAQSLLVDMGKRLDRGEAISKPVKRLAAPKHPAGPTPAQELYAKYQQRKAGGQS